MKKGLSVDEIYRLSGIDKWFLYKIEHIVEIGEKPDLEQLPDQSSKSDKPNIFKD